MDLDETSRKSFSKANDSTKTLSSLIYYNLNLPAVVYQGKFFSIFFPGEIYEISDKKDLPEIRQVFRFFIAPGSC
jgi:hypothetical protein